MIDKQLDRFIRQILMDAQPELRVSFHRQKHQLNVVFFQLQTFCFVLNDENRKATDYYT